MVRCSRRTKLEAGDVVSVFDKDGKEFQYRFLKKKIIPMVYDGQGSGFVEHVEDDQYLADVLDAGNFLNLQVVLSIMHLVINYDRNIGTNELK